MLKSKGTSLNTYLCIFLVDIILSLVQTELQIKFPLEYEKVCLVSLLDVFLSLIDCKVLIFPYIVQLTGNVARRHWRVPQWSPLRGLNADMPCTRPESNCTDKHQPREYFYSSARTSQGSTCTQTC